MEFNTDTTQSWLIFKNFQTDLAADINVQNFKSLTGTGSPQIASLTVNSSSILFFKKSFCLQCWTLQNRVSCIFSASGRWCQVLFYLKFLLLNPLKLVMSPATHRHTRSPLCNQFESTVFYIEKSCYSTLCFSHRSYRGMQVASMRYQDHRPLSEPVGWKCSSTFNSMVQGTSCSKHLDNMWGCVRIK